MDQNIRVEKDGATSRPGHENHRLVDSLPILVGRLSEGDSVVLKPLPERPRGRCHRIVSQQTGTRQ